MSAILIAVEGPQAGDWLAALRDSAKGREVLAWSAGADDLSRVSFACVWLPPRGLLARIPNLKAVINLGAGADHLLADPDLPDVPIARAAHADLTMRVTEYVVLHVLMHHRRQRLYDGQQRERSWRVHDQPAASEVAVGVMGLGVIGAHAAVALAGLGFKVAGWSRSPKTISGVETFHGPAGLDAFLARTEILVCLLPRTRDTEGILNLALLRKLKRDGAAGGAFLINAGRGALQVDAEILAALDEGTLAGTTLDVFQNEPLRVDSPLWSHPKVTITPHNAGDISPRVFAPHVIAQIERFERGLPLDNRIDRTKGY
ncbi:2-hydroxyacid dehydrogenase [Rhodoplanes sp. Z2-YC6860]|uniref:2-hydroxyacid dehydrogenase n=1 Tax=Rhodoplanes sp. Z2-YC6860 TaxID=674703 RepID=UPI00078CB624|nr:glyoxylate/hydroxypyruvate reductase A [Rhodoplanes sp. Z2-YC6860]AMN45124.1 2-hydroxyacid dehydrogenase [Rhodoplanes sp. Z2-YC6860]